MTSSLALRTRPPTPARCVADQRVLDVLLGDRRAALQVAAEDVVLERAREAGEREAGVGVEVAVLGGDHRLAHVHRHLVDVDVDPVAFGRNDFRQLGAVAGQDRRHLVGADVAGLGDVDDEVGHREGDDRQHGSARPPRTYSPRRTHFQLSRWRSSARPPGSGLAAAAVRRRGGRRGGGLAAAGFGGGGVPSSAALTTSIGSRRCGGRAVARPAAGPWSAGRRARGPPRARRPARVAGVCGSASSPSTVWRRSRRRALDAPSAADPLRDVSRLTGRGALRYSLAVRAPSRAVRVPRAPARP